MKYLFAIVLIALCSCSNSYIDKKVEVDQLVLENNYRTIEVDSLFQLSFPSCFSKTKNLSESAILQFNDLSREEHLLVFNTSDDSNSVSLVAMLNEIVRLKKITNENKSESEYDGFSVDRYSCNVSTDSSLEDYSYWLIRFNWSTVSYTICLWTTKDNKDQFNKDVNLIERAFYVM